MLLHNEIKIPNELDNKTKRFSFESKLFILNLVESGFSIN